MQGLYYEPLKDEVVTWDCSHCLRISEDTTTRRKATGTYLQKTPL